MRLSGEAQIRTKLLTVVFLLGILLPTQVFCQETTEASAGDSVNAIISVARFRKVDGSPRLDALETLLPQALKARLFRYRWLQVRVVESGVSDPSVLTPTSSGNSKTVPTFALEGTFVAFENKIRVDVTLRNLVGTSVEFQGFEIFGEDTILDVADRLGKRIIDTLQPKVSSSEEERRISFGIASTFQNQAGGTPFASLGTLLSSVLLNQLLAAKLANVSFHRLEVAEVESSPRKPEAIVTGEYKVSGNEILETARILERSGASFRIDAKGSLDQISSVNAELSSGVLEIIRGRITRDGKWRSESISLVGADPGEYLAQAKKYEESKNFAVAMLMYRKAIEKKPEYVEARSGLADLYVTEGKYERAISEYQEILRQNDKNIAARYGLGTAYLKTGNYRDAIQQMEQLQQFGPSDAGSQAKLHRMLGDAYLLAGSTDKAIQQYLRALQTAGESPDLYHALVRAHRAADQLPRAIEYLSKARERFPDDPEFTTDLAAIYIQQGRHYYNEQKYDQALKQYEMAISLPFDDHQLQAEAYGYRGAIVGHFFTPPNREKGIAYLEKSVELDPTVEWNRRFLGALYEEAGRYPEGLKSLKQALALEPTTYGYRELGSIYRLMKNDDDAIDSLRQALKLRSDYAVAYADLAQIYESKKDADGAIGSLNKYLELEPKSPWGYRELGMIYQDRNDLDKAIANLKKAVELGPSARAYTELGEAYFRNKDHAAALEATEQAIRVDRREPYAYEELEKIYKARGEQGQFIRELERTTSSDPKFVWGHAKLGEAYNKVGRQDDAIASLKRALAVDPKDRWAQELLGMIYVQKRDYDRAKETLETSLKTSATEWAYAELGKVYLLKHDHARAIESLKQALKINGKYEYAYETLESVYAEMKQPQAFVALLEEAVKAHADFVWAFRKLATAYENAGDYDSAIGSLQKAVELKSDAATYVELAEAYQIKENWASEREIGRKLIELDAKSEQGYLHLAQASAGSKEYAQALEAVNKGLEALPRSPLLLSELADIHRLRKEYGPAMEACQKVIELSPKYAISYLVMTRIQLENKDYEKAVASAQKAIDLGVDAFWLLYDAYKGLNRNSEAVRTFKAYLEKSPENPSILATLGAIYHDLLYSDPSAYEQAYRLYQKAYRLQPKNLQVRENFAEANLTTERYDEALKLANNVLGDPTLTPDEKLSMKMIAIASLLCKKENAAAFSELGEFIRYHESISEDYERNWTFEGTKNFLHNSKILGQPEKTLLLTLIDILESPKDKADKKLAALKGSLPLLFQQFQKAAASP